MYYTPHPFTHKSLCMELVAVDVLSIAPKNGRMTKEERKRIGRKLRALRTERGLDQVDVAADPKADGISVGTLQAIEGAWYEVRDQNIEKYARFFGTSMTKLLKADEPKAVTASDPLLKDLNEEHLEIARSYMRARKRTRASIELLLNHPDEEHLTSVIIQLGKLSPDALAQLETVLAAGPGETIFGLMERIRQRLAIDPDFMKLLEESLGVLDKQPKPKTQTSRKSGTTPTRSA